MRFELKQICMCLLGLYGEMPFFSFPLSLSLDALKSPCPCEARVKRPKGTWERRAEWVFGCVWNCIFSVCVCVSVCVIEVFFGLMSELSGYQ